MKLRRLKPFRWNNEKNIRLKKERGVSFEEIVEAIEEDHLLDDLIHHNLQPRQRHEEKIYSTRRGVAMPDEHIYEEPLDEEERQLMRELEAGEWISNPDFVRPNFAVTDTFVETVSALEASSDELARVLRDSYRWKWVILALHSALQGMMALALEGSNGLRVLKPKDAKRWLDAYESGAPLPADLEMDNFLNLYEKIKNDTILFYVTSKKFTPEGTQGKSIKDLNRLRNQFIHFTPCSLSLVLNGLP